MELADLSLTLRSFLKAYRWRRIDPVPRSVRTKPLEECRIALVSSAGLVAPGDTPFDPKLRGGDYSYRVVPRDADLASLEDHHRSESYDHSGVETDRNVVLPLDRLHEMAADGAIGEVAPRHISVMGSITAPGRLIKWTIPEITEMLCQDQVDLALLIPV